MTRAIRPIALVPGKTHVIEETRMRETDEEHWTLCRCGWLVKADSSEQLAALYAGHISRMKGGAFA